VESTKSSFPDPYINGLPFYLGLNTCALDSENVSSPIASPQSIPRFYYQNLTDLSLSNGFWLTPNTDLSGAAINYIQAPMKINLLGPSYFYIDIAGLNYVDETSPFNVSQFTISRNQTNSVVNSSFAKIGVTTSPNSQFFNYLPMDSYKYFNPPAERIRRLRVKLRYHNGQYVNFSNAPFSFTLEFTVLKPMILRNLVATKSYTTL
jgi:hypothetical protein